MLFDNLFSLAGLIAIFGWLTLLLSPLMPIWSDRLAGIFLPVALSLGYVLLLIVSEPADEGGFQTLADVMTLFTFEQAALAGWVHFLAFDLFIGAWACRRARAEGICFVFVAPCLPVIFLLGPAGLLVFQAVRAAHSQLKPT